jgi:hypothetical protein
MVEFEDWLKIGHSKSTGLSAFFPYDLRIVLYAQFLDTLLFGVHPKNLVGHLQSWKSWQCEIYGIRVFFSRQRLGSEMSVCLEALACPK